MKLESCPPQPQVSPPSSIPGCPIHAYIDQSPVRLQPSTWVELVEPPSLYSEDVALLLCQEAENRWRGWIPGYGEASILNLSFS